MDFNKLTTKAQEAIAASQELARRNANPEIYPDHLLLALLTQELPQTLAERVGYVPSDEASGNGHPLLRTRDIHCAFTGAQQPAIDVADRVDAGALERRSDIS